MNTAIRRLNENDNVKSSIKTSSGSQQEEKKTSTINQKQLQSELKFRIRLKSEQQTLPENLQTHD